jgi:hypothetical protein
MPGSKPKYETDRTRHFRTQELDATDTRTIDHIEQFGCSIFHISGEAKQDRPLLSYTVGVYDTCGQPEIICIGLKEGLTQSVLNAAADALRDGVNLSEGRHKDLIGDVECEFRPVDPKWGPHLMGWCRWYYQGANFPVLQVIYPDTQNRFPEDEGFNTYFAQPMLQSGMPWTRREEDFWAEHDPKSSLFDWKFPDPPHTGVYLSKTVHKNEEEITYVSHDIEDGAWQFLGDLMDEGGGPVISCLHHPIDKDPTLKELADLPIGWCATRTKPGEPWLREAKPPEGPEDEQE